MAGNVRILAGEPQELNQMVGGHRDTRDGIPSSNGLVEGTDVPGIQE